MRIPFAAQAYQARSLPLSAQRLVNLYAEQAPEGAPSPLVVYGTPGLSLFADLGTGPVRGLRVAAGVLCVVAGQTLYAVSSEGTATALGTIPGTGIVRMTDNGTQLVVVTPETGAGYVYDTDGPVFAQITDPDWPGAGSCDFIDQYGVFTVPGTGRFFISALADLTSYDALDIATAESAPDALVRVFVDHREVWLFGTDSTEVWYNSGAAAFPFERVSGGILERGCAAAGSVAKCDNTVFWLGNDRVLYRAAGYQPQRISTHAIEYALAQVPDLSDAEAFTYTQEGHGFYCLTVPQANAGAGMTLCYDVATGLWHERVSGASAALRGRWRAQGDAYAYGRTIVGDCQTGKLYDLGLDTYTENGATIRRLATSPVVQADGRRMLHARLEVQVESGAGLLSGQGEDPQAMLRWSDDGGRTWGNDHWASMGAQGQYSRRVQWRRMGASRNRVYELSISDPVKVAIIGATLDTQPLGG